MTANRSLPHSYNLSPLYRFIESISRNNICIDAVRLQTAGAAQENFPADFPAGTEECG